MKITLTLDISPMPKARPRAMIMGGRIHSHHSHEYLAWMQEASGQFAIQWAGNPTIKAIKKLSIQFWGNSAKCDVDNLAGAVMDALVKAGILFTDNVNSIPHLETAWERIGKQESPRIEVILELAPTPPKKPARKSRKTAVK